MENNLMEHIEIELLLLKCFKEEASEQEYLDAWQWINKDKENLDFYSKFRDAWVASSLNKQVNTQQIEASWNRVKARIKQNNEDDKNKKISSRIIRTGSKIMKIAAVLIITFGLGAIVSHYYFLPDRITAPIENEFYTIEAPKGAKSLVTLTDGTKVWLNAGSQIKCSRSYNLYNRDITLKGEAYFEVAKNPNLAFQVQTSGITVKALGTIFNVKSYPGEKTIEATLVEGSISVYYFNREGESESIILKPNQKMSYYKSENTLALETKPSIDSNFHTLKPIQIIKPKTSKVEIARDINTEIYTSWKDKRWIFVKEDLGSFALKLERQYDVTIIFKNEELKQYKLTGSLEEETLEQVLKAIQLTVPMDYKIEHKIVYFNINKDYRNTFNHTLKPKK